MSTNCYTNTKDAKKKFIKTFDLSQIAEDPMDIYLESLGLWKKRIARDGTCLFRAVAEQIYPCQMYHQKVREECLNFMLKNRQDYEKYTTIPFDDYLESMKNPLEYGGQLEILAMSKLYRRDFMIYQQPNIPGIDVTQNGFTEKILICYSFNNHYDAIFSKVYRDNLAFVQSLVYEILYEKIFGSAEQVDIARRLLRKSDTIYPREYMDAINQFNFNENEITSNNGDYNILTNDLSNNVIDENNNYSYPSNDDENNKEKNDNQKMPLPYKVAKSLDPVIYRNTAFDAWLATKKEFEEELNHRLVLSLQPGDRCLVKLGNYGSTWMVAYLQSFHNDLGNIIIPDLHESHCVSLENIKPFIDYSAHQNNLYNVHKLVQPINAQFSTVFLNQENKRKNMKKKQFTMKKSSSFHAFSTELPTLHEVNEDQNEDYFHYQGYDYYNPAYPIHAPASNYNNNGPHLVHSLSSYANFCSEKGYENSLTKTTSNNQIHANNVKNHNIKNKKQKIINYKTWNNQNQNYNSNNFIGMAPMPNSSHIGATSSFYPPSNSINAPLITQQNYTSSPFNNGTTHYQNNSFVYPTPQGDNSFFYANTCQPFIANKQMNTLDPLQNQRKRHGSSDSYLNKQHHTNATFQQVPQHMGHNQNIATELNNTSTSNYLLMPAPAAPQPTLPHSIGGISRSHSYHAGISAAAYETNQSSNDAQPVYIDLFIPQHPQVTQNQSSIYTPANNQSMMIQQNQPMLMNTSSNSSVVLTAGAPPLYTNGCLDNQLGYDSQYARSENNNETNFGTMDVNRQNIIWNKNTKLGKNHITSLPDMMYNENQTGLGNQQPFCYTNCFVVNIDGPINFNATHSVMDDGTDLKLNDINTLRFFYNLGIEYYRLNIANGGQSNVYYTSQNNGSNLNQQNHTGQKFNNFQNCANNNNNLSISNNNMNMNTNGNSNIPSHDVEKSTQHNTIVSIDQNISATNQQVVPNSNSSKPTHSQASFSGNQIRRTH